MTDGQRQPPKVKKINKEGIDPDTQLRIINFINSARRPDDIVRKEGAKISKDVAKSIIEKKKTIGAYGLEDLSQLADISGFDLGAYDNLVTSFGPAFYGEWVAPYSTQYPDGTIYHVAHAVLLHTGKVLFFPESDTKDTLLWDPSDEVTPQFEFLLNQPDEFIFCSGHSFLSDGRLLVVGGGGGGPSNVNRAWKFDPVSKSWRRTRGDMVYPRWYPTAVTLGDGKVLVVSGAGDPLASDRTSEIYDEFTDSFTLITGPNSERAFPQLYPGLHLLPGGEIFYTRTGFGFARQPPEGGPSGGDPIPGTPYFKFTGPTTGKWVEIENMMEFQDRVRGMSVLLLDPCHPAVRVMIIGGSSMPGAERAEIINLSTLSPTWEHSTTIPGGVMRIQANTVLLPDNTVFVCGGTTTPDLPCALYDPSTNTWHEMARVNYRKQYHSVALLLPNGKVLATGGSNYGEGSNAIEIFSPPYLFRGPRPDISSVPDMVHHGETFDLETPQASEIQKVVLVRPMAVTHQTDTEQRVIQTKFTQNGEGMLRVITPDHMQPHLAPRGYYMLFILNRNGVPSVGKFILLH